MSSTKDRLINIRVTEEQKNDIRRKAEALGLSVSDFLRMLGLCYEVRVREE